MEKNYIICPFEIKEQTEDEEYFVVEGMAAVYGNIDLGDDLIEQGAFKLELIKDNTRPVLWQHYSSEPIGVGVFEEMSNGLFVKIRMPKNDQFVKERVMPQIKIGSVKGLSIGYTTEDYEYVTIGERRIRKLKRLGLREVSAVTFPMNQEAQILAAKQYLLNHVESLEIEDSKTVPPFKNYDLAGNDIKWDKTKSVNQIRKLTGSEKAPSSKYKNGFMYFDPETSDSFGAYKLPFTYVIGGSIKAIPKALSSIVGAISGDRGLNIPATDLTKVKSQINKYYKKMGREEPFQKGITLIDKTTIKEFETRDLEKIFDESIIISAEAKKYIADLLSTRFVDNKQDGSIKALNELLKNIKEIK